MGFNMVRFPDNLAQTIAQAAAVELRKIAKANVRKDSEDLENSIRLDRYPDGSRVVSANTEYAAVQEYGHPYYPSRSAPPSVPKSGPGGPYTYNPYMRPAAKEVQDDMRQIVRKFTPAAIRDSRR